MPSRFAIVLMMAFSVIFALALAHIADRLPRHRRPVLLGAVWLMLAVELSPLPRRVFAAPIPGIYQIIADDPRDVSVLGIPFGFSDGEGGGGRYNGASQFYQTFHQKRIVGGAMSRISENERRRQRRPPVRRALLRLSEGAPITQREFEAAKVAAPEFVRRARLGYVVIDTPATSAELREFVIEIFGLVKIAESDGRELTVSKPLIMGVASEVYTPLDYEKFPLRAYMKLIYREPRLNNIERLKPLGVKRFEALHDGDVKPVVFEQFLTSELEFSVEYKSGILGSVIIDERVTFVYKRK
jgi:hypothetical protein